MLRSIADHHQPGLRPLGQHLREGGDHIGDPLAGVLTGNTEHRERIASGIDLRQRSGIGAGTPETEIKALRHQGQPFRRHAVIGLDPLAAIATGGEHQGGAAGIEALQAREQPEHQPRPTPLTEGLLRQHPLDRAGIGQSGSAGEAHAIDIETDAEVIAATG